jgi:hypothetical protein
LFLRAKKRDFIPDATGKYPDPGKGYDAENHDYVRK